MGEIVSYDPRGTANAPGERRRTERRSDQRRQSERRRAWPDAAFVAQVLCGRGPAAVQPAHDRHTARPQAPAKGRACHPAFAAYEEAYALARTRTHAEPADEVDRAV